MKKVVPENAVLIPDEAELAFKGLMFDVYQWQQEMFDGSKDTFEMLRRVDILKVFVIVDGKLLLQKEEQPAVGTFYDIPGGRHDVPGETYLQAAQREVLEETGMTLKNWRLINVRQIAHKIECFTYFYVATDLIDTVDMKLDAGEKIKNQYVSFDEYVEMGKNDELRTWPTLPTDIKTLDELLVHPEFKGKEIER